MSQGSFLEVILLILHILILAAVIVRVLLRPHREPASRVAWLVVIISLPVLGILAYILLGEPHIGRRRVEEMRRIISHLPDMDSTAGAGASNMQVDVP